MGLCLFSGSLIVGGFVFRGGSEGKVALLAGFFLFLCSLGWWGGPKDGGGGGSCGGSGGGGGGGD